MQKKTVRDVEVSGKRVLIRVDFNVPLGAGGAIEDDTRIRACLPTIAYLRDHRARIILCSHLGRPHGKVDERLRLAPVGRRLAELLGVQMTVLGEAIGPSVRRAVAGMKDGDIVLLENLRFYPGEEADDPAFARELAGLAELVVNDAFGASHRAHASVAGVAAYLPCVAGLLMEKEITRLGALLENPERPFAAVMGGAKAGEKMGILEHILPKVDVVLVGGGMAATFLKARGFSVGDSVVETDRLEFVTSILGQAHDRGVRVLLPLDVIVAATLEEDSGSRIVETKAIPPGVKIADIGPRTIDWFTGELTRCRTVVWNGPMGVFEVREFSHGTVAIATALADLNATTVIGGGSTAEAVTQLGLAGRMTHVSTGGGASLRFLSGKPLPGIEALADRA